MLTEKSGDVNSILIGQNIPTYKLQAAEGGWGYIITLAVAVMLIVTVGPLAAFGIIYGGFMRQIGDESAGTTTLTCVLNTVCCFMGLVANKLLQNYSCRFVGILGCLIFFVGNFLTAFATSLLHITITFGVLQGIGLGLMVPACFTSFNQYFVMRRNLMMGLAHTVIGAVTMVMPLLARYLIDCYGFRGTVAILSAFSLHALLAMITLQPSKWHMRKVTFSVNEMSDFPLSDLKEKEINTKCTKSLAVEASPFITQETKSIDENKETPCDESKPISNTKKIERKRNSMWQCISDFLEISLLKDPSYVNISVGIATSFLSDIMFMSLLPMFLLNMHFSKLDIAFIMTIYTGADLLGRLLFSVFTALITIKNRYLFLFGTIVSIILRIGFTLGGTSWLWICTVSFSIGLLRCFIQVPIPLVLVEYSEDRFTAAFCLYQTICGVVSLALGPLSGLVASATAGDAWVQHLLTLLLLLCALPWAFELTLKYFK